MSGIRLYPLPEGWSWTAVADGEAVRLTALQSGAAINPIFSLSTPPTARALWRQSKYISRKVNALFGAQSEANRLAREVSSITAGITNNGLALTDLFPPVPAVRTTPAG